MTVQSIDMSTIPSGNYKKYSEMYDKMRDRLAAKGLRMQTGKFTPTEFHIQYKVVYANRLAEVDGQKSKVGNVYETLVKKRQARAIPNINSAKAAQKRYAERTGKFLPLENFIYEGEIIDEMHRDYIGYLNEIDPITGKRHTAEEAQMFISGLWFGSE